MVWMEIPVAQRRVMEADLLNRLLPTPSLCNKETVKSNILGAIMDGTIKHDCIGRGGKHGPFLVPLSDIHDNFFAWHKNRDFVDAVSKVHPEYERMYDSTTLFAPTRSSSTTPWKCRRRAGGRRTRRRTTARR